MSETGWASPLATVEASAYTVPTERPEADGTLAWDASTMVVVRAGTADPLLPHGLGWTYAPAVAADVVREVLAPEVRGIDALDVGSAWLAMSRAVRNAGRPGLVSMAVSAVDTALWDLKARLLGLPLHHLLGGGALRRSAPVYGSGGFTTQSEDELRHQVCGWVDDGIRQVKIKIGESWGREPDRDLARTALTRASVGEDVDVFVDANGGYTAKQAVRQARRLEELGVTWFEEPVSSEDPAGLRLVRDHTVLDVTAGEYGAVLEDFARLLGARAVDCLQVDASRCGGYTGWLRAAVLAESHGLEVSAHCAPTLHLPVCLVTPNLRHQEYFADHVRVETRLLDPPPDAAGGVLRPADGPGHGRELKETDAERWRTR